MKKGRHRRFEEARKLKQQGPGAFLPGEPNGRPQDTDTADDDEFAELAKKYGAYDDETEEDADDED